MALSDWTGPVRAGPFRFGGDPDEQDPAGGAERLGRRLIEAWRAGDFDPAGTSCDDQMGSAGLWMLMYPRPGSNPWPAPDHSYAERIRELMTPAEHAEMERIWEGRWGGPRRDDTPGTQSEGRS